jgi:Cu+-exporting ATPase
MGQKIAVVFDSAGTLLHMYRIAKTTAGGKFLEDIESTMLVAGSPGRALVVMHAGLEEILSEDNNSTISDFIYQNQIEIDIVCSNGSMSIEETRILVREGNVLMGDLHEVINRVHKRCPDVFYVASGLIVDRELNGISHVLSTGGRLYPGSSNVLSWLRDNGVDAYIASGDSMSNLRRLAKCLAIPLEGVFDIATPEDKENIVKNLKKRYANVVMVGDGMNDILALRAADMGIVTRQQGDKRPDILLNAADKIIDDITEVIDLVSPFLR